MRTRKRAQFKQPQQLTHLPVNSTVRHSTIKADPFSPWHFQESSFSRSGSV